MALLSACCPALRLLRPVLSTLTRLIFPSSPSLLISFSPPRFSLLSSIPLLPSLRSLDFLGCSLPLKVISYPQFPSPQSPVPILHSLYLSLPTIASPAHHSPSQEHFMQPKVLDSSPPQSTIPLHLWFVRSLKWRRSIPQSPTCPTSVNLRPSPRQAPL